MKYSALNKTPSSTFFTFLTLLLFLGINLNAQEKEDKTYIKTTVKDVKYELVDLETNVVYNPYTFTWFAWEDPVLVKKKVTNMEMVPVSEFDRPPVFSGDCLIAEDKFACTNKKIREYASEKFLEYPEAASEQEQEGLEYVTFTLNEDGNFEGNLKVISKNDPCPGCSDAAVNIVSEMEDQWFPAIKDGETVKTQLTIPIRFNLIDDDY